MVEKFGVIRTYNANTYDHADKHRENVWSKHIPCRRKFWSIAAKTRIKMRAEDRMPSQHTEPDQFELVKQIVTVEWWLVVHVQDLSFNRTFC